MAWSWRVSGARLTRTCLPEGNSKIQTNEIFWQHLLLYVALSLFFLLKESSPSHSYPRLNQSYKNNITKWLHGMRNNLTWIDLLKLQVPVANPVIKTSQMTENNRERLLIMIDGVTVMYKLDRVVMLYSTNIIQDPVALTEREAITIRSRVLSCSTGQAQYT